MVALGAKSALALLSVVVVQPIIKRFNENQKLNKQDQVDLYNYQVKICLPHLKEAWKHRVETDSLGRVKFAEFARTFKKMGIDTSIIAKHPTLVQPKLVGERGRAGTIIEVLTDGAGKCYDFFGGWLAHKLYSVYTFKFLQAAANAVKGTGQCMSCWVMEFHVFEGLRPMRRRDKSWPWWP